MQALSGNPDDIRYKTIGSLPEILSLEKGKTIHGVSENGYFYSAIRLENSPHVLIFTQPENELFLANKAITNSLWIATVVIIVLMLCILVYLSKRITQPLSTLIKTMDEHQDGPVPQQNIDTAFHELDNFVESYNHAWQRVSLLMDQVREETHLREKAHYDLLISQISPHFICNTVNSIKYLAAEEGGSASVDALDALSEILQSVYQTQCLCKAADVPYRGEHVFRHTFATNCYHKGIDVKILSRLLGHADVNITYNIYVHLYGDGFDEMYSALVSEK